MIRRETPSGTVSGLRTRFAPKSRIGQGLVSVAPWINAVMLLFLFAFMQSRYVLQPGVVVELPSAPFTEGTPYGMVAVILSVGGNQGVSREQIVYFDDERFRMEVDEHINALQKRLARELRRHPDSPLIIQADQNIPHGVVVRMMNMAMDAGFSRVNIAARPR
jgi:biopolymer transport protein ExbD